MNKFNSPSSNNSGTSSEASETASVEDNASNSGQQQSSASAISRLPKTWKRLKEAPAKDDAAEAKRPPWRAVSVSTLPKPDKSALLRAKLLDASRRLRASKNSVALQTDMEPTKLMKEVCIGAQTDLILYKEVGMLTDGSYTQKKKSHEQFILTYSVSQMTDGISSIDAETQTLLPKVCGDDFLDAYKSSESCAPPPGDYNELERKLLHQIGRLRKSAAAHADDATTPASYSPSTSNYSSDTDATVRQAHDVNAQLISPEACHSRPSLLRPTLDSWHFEYDSLERASDSGFYPYLLGPSRQWGQQTPLPLTVALRNGPLNSRQTLMDWSLLLLAIDELVQESNRLVDLIEHITARHNERVGVADLAAQQRQRNAAVETHTLVASFQPHRQAYPSDYWRSVVEQQEQQLYELQN